MIVNTQKMVSMTEANQNFSKVAKIANAEGSALVMRNNKPEYILLKINNNQNIRIGILLIHGQLVSQRISIIHLQTVVIICRN